MKQKEDISATSKAKVILQRMRSPVLRTSDILEQGIHVRTLYQLRDDGFLEQMSRGVYRLQDQDTLDNPDWVIVFTRIPQAVICLVSALSFHEITTQIPHEVSIALMKGAESPRLKFPPLKVHRFSGPAFLEGIEEYHVNGIPVRVYNPEKTLADCFKFRNQLGMDIVMEALKLYKTRKKFSPDKLLKYARICRVENVMRPYLESIL